MSQSNVLDHEVGAQELTYACYSTFSNKAKRGIVLLVALAGFFSPLSANIYFPALEYIASDLHVSLELMNLTITAYLVCQGLVPFMVGDLADRLGRRPIYLAIFVIYLAANLGLALQKSYSALLILRILQSSGSSGQKLVFAIHGSGLTFACRTCWTGVLMQGRRETRKGKARTPATYLRCLVSRFFPSSFIFVFLPPTRCLFSFLFRLCLIARSHRPGEVVGVVSCPACPFSLPCC